MLILFVLIAFVVFFVPFHTRKIAADELPVIQCRQFLLENSIFNSVASDNVNSFAFGNNNSIDSIDILSGEKNWSIDVGGNITGRILVNSGFTYVTNKVKKNERGQGGENVLSLRSVSNNSGLTVWKTELDDGKSIIDKSSPEQVFIYNLRDELLLRANFCFLSVNKINGGVKWKKCIEPDLNITDVSNIKANVFGNSLVIYDRNYIYLLAVETGEITKKITVGAEELAVFQLIDDSFIALGDKKGRVSYLNIGNMKVLWTVKSGGAISGIVKTERGILVSSLDNFIYMLDLHSGRKIWKKRFAGRLREKLSVKNNLAIVIDNGKNSYFLDISDGKTVGHISLPDNEYFIQAPEFIDEYYLFLTNKRALVYINGICPKRESDVIS